ncbi:MAG TPA: glycine cleavage system aminomethyltransferase GcvT [Nocardioides sp.]|uniref:glycine cleavage system aminomethyltransferase GcvT n=1 Tax=Nocardioides sp. TaxID=35761 RepID=UPI002E370C85|nr:glycine cleavage system aminomethyltransferase GcvT [Nocardioides sp.]HEX5090322.1 glycine cleavage system aminomethyltransferase GcvT [Nocardioides sp.]
MDGTEPHAEGGPLTSPLHERHLALGAKFADFGGWSMPLEYPSGVVKEHTAVREAVGLFDVSHLGKITVVGPGAADYVNATLTNDLGRIRHGKAQYTLCCDDATGGIVDDLIAYLHTDDRVLLVPNAANTAEVARRLIGGAPDGIAIKDRHRDYVVLAVQGTKSDEVLEKVGLPAGHEYMSFVEAPVPGDDQTDAGVVVCRTGYTGERGYELIAANSVAGVLWDQLMAAGEEFGMLPCGLGARDTLRTEMGYPLHGQDISLSTTPNEGRLGWAVGWSKPAFWGREVLRREKEEGPKRILRGIVATGRAIPRPGMAVSLTPDVQVGEVTSGTFSPTLRKGVGLALVSAVVNPEAEVGVDVRGRREIFQVTQPPFVQPKVRES